MLPLLKWLERQPDFELHLAVTGMHMLKTYGSTHHEVASHGFSRCYLIPNQIEQEQMASVLGNTVCLLARLADEIEPDMVMVHGDRVEALAAASVGALGNRLVCHIEGGELSGTIDDSLRHAVSKLAHLHLVANRDAAERLRRMGEEAGRIHIIGSPDLDVMRSPDLPALAEVKRHYGIPFEDYGISMFHPVTTETAQMKQYARQYFQALKNSGRRFVAVYPNNDAGGRWILDELAELPPERFRVFPSIRFEAFLVLLKHARLMVGNSSAGIREAPFYGIPSVDVGTRQQGRYHGPSIIRCGYALSEIEAALEAADGRRFAPDEAFGGGSCSSTDCFAAFMQTPELWQTPLQKRFDEGGAA